VPATQHTNETVHSPQGYEVSATGNESTQHKMACPHSHVARCTYNNMRGDAARCESRGERGACGISTWWPTGLAAAGAVAPATSPAGLPAATTTRGEGTRRDTRVLKGAAGRGAAPRGCGACAGTATRVDSPLSGLSTGCTAHEDPPSGGVATPADTPEPVDVVGCCMGEVVGAVTAPPS